MREKVIIYTEKVIIYTDGACSGNPGPGGYGVVLLKGQHRKELSGGFRSTTNNRMEIVAAIEGLKDLKTQSEVTLYTDSQLLVNAMTKGWIQRWEANGWRRGPKTDVLNTDLWVQLMRVRAQHKVQFVWTRGHSGTKENERCDELARQAIHKRLDIDGDYEQSRETENSLNFTKVSQGRREEPTSDQKEVSVDGSLSCCTSNDIMPYEYRTRRKIEFSDTDMAGIVHFAQFFVFMETAEHEFLRTLKTSVATEWEGNQIGWPRLQASCEYLSPAKFEDELDIHLTVSRKGTKSITYQFAFRKGNVVIARGQVTAACCICNPGEKLRTIPIPDFIADKIEEAPRSDV